MGRVETKRRIKPIRDEMKNKRLRDKELLMICIKNVCKMECLHQSLYDSLTEGLSYEKLSGRYYVPINRNSFYDYQKKCLEMYMEFKNTKVKF